MDNNYIIDLFYNSRNEELSVPMANYMKNLFPFLGMKTPERKELSKQFLNERKKDTEVDWEFIYRCFDLPEREFREYSKTDKKWVKNFINNNELSKLSVKEGSKYLEL